MELGVNSPAKLEPFLLMSKSAKGAAAAKLVQDATSAPGVFVFAELLELPNVQELSSSPQHAPFYSLLQLFAYRTYADYLQHQSSLPPLNSAQTTKLKHLTLVSLSMEKRILPYTQLLDQLQMPTIRELEDLIIDAIYLDVIRGKLDQKGQQFEVEYTMGRDLEPGKIESMLMALQNWASATSAVLSTIDTRLQHLKTQVKREQNIAEVHEAVLQRNLREVLDKQRERNLIKVNSNPAGGPPLVSGPTAAGLALIAKQKEKERENQNASGGGGGGGGGDRMDVDDTADGKGRNKQPLAESPSSTRGRKRNRF